MSKVILTAGPMLDAQVAQSLWKAIVMHDPETETSTLIGEDRKPVPLPRFSKEVTAAHRVSQQMQAQGWTMLLRQVTEGEAHWLCAFTKPDGRTYLYSKCSTMPLSICVAAMAAHQGRNVG